MDSATAALLAPLAEGSMERALELDNDSLAQRRDLLVRHLAEISLQRVATIFQASEELSNSREETLENMDMLLSLSRDLLHLTSGCDDITNSTIRPTLVRLSSRLSLPGALRLADDILETRRSIQRNANAKLALDNLFMKIAGALAA